MIAESCDVRVDKSPTAVALAAILITAEASPYEVGDGVITNFYLGTDGGPLPNPFLHYEFNLTPFVAGGGDFQLRFRTVNSVIGGLNVGVDNVSIRAVPEPSTRVLLLGVCIVAFMFVRARRRGIGSA